MSNQSFSSQVHQNAYCQTEYRLNCQDTFHKIGVEADLIIKITPSFLEGFLEDAEKPILICHNITLSSDDYDIVTSEAHFTRFISKVLAELYLFCLAHQLPGVLIFIPEIDIKEFTELQRRCLRVFINLFSYAEMSPKGVYHLYMPADVESFQYYSGLQASLEQQLASISKE